MSSFYILFSAIRNTDAASQAFLAGKPDGYCGLVVENFKKTDRTGDVGVSKLRLTSHA